jgi:hypothetical protein
MFNKDDFKEDISLEFASRGTWVRQDTANARYAAANIFNFVAGREGAA